MKTHRTLDEHGRYTCVSLCGKTIPRSRLSDTPTCQRCRTIVEKPPHRDGSCSACSKITALTTSGLVWSHLPDGAHRHPLGTKPCPGSGKPPKHA